MAKKDHHLVALDIGSTKTCALICEVEGENVKFLALGAAESKGLRKGLIVTLEAIVSSIRRAVEEAEAAAGFPVETALVGVAGSHVRGVNSRGGITLGARPRNVNREDLRRAVEVSRNVTLPDDREILHVLPQEFLLDGHNNIRDPLGMVGTKLEANVHLVTTSSTATQNIITAANKAGILVSDTVLEPLADAETTLTQDERELGCCLLNIGGGSTEILIITGGIVRHTGAVPIGGDHFTNDLAVGLRTPIPEAENIKREYGCALRELLHDDRAIEIASVGDRPPRVIYERMLCDIVEPRAQELLYLVREELKRSGLDAVIPAGLVFTGGGARLRGLVELSERIFELPVRIGVPRGFTGMPEEIVQPEYTTVAGLLLYGARARRQSAEHPAGFGAKLKALFAGQ